MRNILEKKERSWKLKQPALAYLTVLLQLKRFYSQCTRFVNGEYPKMRMGADMVDVRKS
jgi:hypothetical protein